MSKKILRHLCASGLLLLGLYNAWLMFHLAPRETWGNFLLVLGLALSSVSHELFAYHCLSRCKHHIGFEPVTLAGVGAAFLTVSLLHAVVGSIEPNVPLSMIRFLLSFTPLAMPLFYDARKNDATQPSR